MLPCIWDKVYVKQLNSLPVRLVLLEQGKTGRKKDDADELLCKYSGTTRRAV